MGHPTATTDGARQTDAVRAAYARQYESLKTDVRALDEIYLKVTLLYLTIGGALIASHSIWTQGGGLPQFAALLPLPVCLCVLGVIYRVRTLIEHHEDLLRKLELRLLFEQLSLPSGIAAIRTSSFLTFLVIFVTAVISVLILRTS